MAAKKKSSSKKQQDNFSKQVRAFYSDEDGSVPDLSKITPAKRHRVRSFFFGASVFALLLAGAAWAGFAVFSPYQKFNAQDFVVKVVVPETARSGDTTNILVVYEVRSASGLKNADITLKVPDNFHIVSTTPAPTDATHWSLGTLATHTKGELLVRGKVLGAPGSLVSLQAFVNYTSEAASTHFQSVATSAFLVDGSVLVLTPTLPSSVSPGENVTAQLSYHLDSKTPLTDVGFRIRPPVGFVPATTSTDPLAWIKADTLQPDATGTVSLIGTFSSATKGDVPFLFESAFLSSQGIATIFSSATGTVHVLGGELVLTTIVNGSAEVKPLAFGDRLHATISYKNTSESALDHVRITAALQSSPQQGKETLVEMGSLDVGKGSHATTTIVWTEKELPSLAHLAPGDEGSIDVSFRLVDTPYPTEKKEYALTIAPSATIGLLRASTPQRIALGTPLVYPIMTNLHFTAQSRYYNDDEIPVGTGPLPPKAGEATTYRLFFLPTNSFHDLKDLQWTTTLPENVQLTGKQNVTAGEVHFNQSNRELRWTLNQLPAKAPPIMVDVEVALTPSDKAVGNELPLTGPIQFSATDAVVNTSIVKALDGLSTALDGDPLAEGKGKVVR